MIDWANECNEKRIYGERGTGSAETDGRVLERAAEIEGDGSVFAERVERRVDRGRALHPAADRDRLLRATGIQNVVDPSSIIRKLLVKLFLKNK